MPPLRLHCVGKGKDQPMTDQTQFDYLLNDFEQASQSDRPADLDYAGKRKVLYAYVRGLEGKAQQAAESERDRALEEAAAHFESSHRELWTPAIAEEIRALKSQPAQADKEKPTDLEIIDRAKEALGWSQQDDWLVRPGTSILPPCGLGIIHVDDLCKAVLAAIATPPAAPKEPT
jgi:acyl-CoA-binding protein